MSNNKLITEEWLLAVGAKVLKDGVLTLSAYPESENIFCSLDFWQGRLCEWWYCTYQRLGRECDRVSMPEQKTQDDVRQLCQVLRIPLQEPLDD